MPKNKLIDFKDYEYHPIWSINSQESFYNIFRLKGFDIEEMRYHEKRKPAEYFIKLLSHSRFGRQVIYMITESKEQSDKIMQSLEAYRTKIRLSVFSYNALEYLKNESLEKRYVFYDSQKQTFFIAIEKLEDLKYVFSILPQQSPMNLGQTLKKIADDNDIVKHTIRNETSFNYINTIKKAVARASDETQLTINRLNEFFSTHDSISKSAISHIPKAFLLYEIFRCNGLPYGWKMGYDMKNANIYFRYDVPIIIKSAWIQEKITPIKLPIWIEKIYITLGSNTYVQGIGFHNDFAQSRINIPLDVCTGNIPYAKMLDYAEAGDYEKCKDTLLGFVRGMSVTNLDHPHWSYGSHIYGFAQKLNETNILDEFKDKNRVAIEWREEANEIQSN